MFFKTVCLTPFSSEGYKALLAFYDKNETRDPFGDQPYFISSIIISKQVYKKSYSLWSRNLKSILNKKFIKNG